MIATMSVLLKNPGWEHRWHSDIENVIDLTRCDRVGYTAWVPISVASDMSTMLMISGTQDATQTAQAAHAAHVGKQCKVCKTKPDGVSVANRGASLTRVARSSGAVARGPRGVWNGHVSGLDM